MTFDDDQSPPPSFSQAACKFEFRRIFAERAQQHLTTNGALTPEKAAARYDKWAKQIESAVLAESARWGNYRRDVHPIRRRLRALHPQRPLAARNRAFAQRILPQANGSGD